MQYTATDIQYIEGQAFSVDYPLQLNQAGPVVQRTEYLETLCTGKSVLHVGCVDHLDTHERKLNDGSWLHGRLLKCATFLAGVDTEAEGIRCLREEMGIGNVFEFDITAADAPPELAGHTFDYVVLGEVIEHVDNPGEFLAALARHEFLKGAEVIITTPNVYSIRSMLKAVRAHENINSDHRYWFSPFTLAKVASRAGLQPSELRFCQLGTNYRKSMLKRGLFKLLPQCATGLILHAKIA